MYKSNKKAQVTVFIIVGLIIVILAAFSYYYSENFIESLRERGIFETIALPLEVKGVEGLVDSCIDEIARSALDIIGQQGGYILLPEPEFVTPANPFSNALEIFPGSNINVAYWFYQTSNGLLDSLIPPKQRMEQEIESYINANLANCVDFSNLDFNIISGEVKSEVKILNEDVRINVEYPLDIELEERNFRLREFNQDIDVPLGNLYETALEVIEKENEDFLLEEKTIDFINVYDEIPYSGVDFECTPRRWKKEDVINDLKDVLDVNINSYRVKDTINSDVEDDYRILELLESARDINVNFEYSTNWPLLIDITPEGEVLEGESFNKGSIGRFLTPFFCLNQYNFIYDLKYPILISLEKDDYVFQFATQIIVDNNQPRENKIEIDQTHDTNPIICQHPLTKIKVFALGVNEDGSLEELDNAKISYKCSTTTCNIGETKNFDETILLDERFPQCINGQLIVEKEGYHRSESELSTMEETTVSVLMEKIYELPYEIKINENGVIRNINLKEQVTLTFRDDVIGYTETILSTDNNKIKLIDGSYNVDGFVLFDSEVFVEGKDLETCLDKPRSGILGIIGLTEKECINTKIEGTTLPQVLTGGSKFQWNVDREDLANAKKVIFFVNSFGIPSNTDELNNVYNKVDTQSVVKPEFEK